MGPGRPLRAAPLLLLHLAALRPAPGAAEPGATIDGRALSVSSLREAERRTFTCLSAAPSLAWYLNGRRQEGSGSPRLMAEAEAAAAEEEEEEGGGVGAAFAQRSSRGGGSSSTFVVTARRLDRQLDCSATDPATGRVSNASVVLNVQFRPEIVELDARYEEGREPGLLLVLFALVQANPPAHITWVDQDGRTMVNTSTFLIVDTKTYPWLTNHTVQVQLSSLASNISLRAANPVGTTTAPVLLPGLLDTHIELPILALVVGGAVALGALLCLGTLVSCVVYREGKKAAAAAGPPSPEGLPLSDFSHQRPSTARLPRANISLPANLQLNDLPPEPKAELRADGAPVEEEEEEEEEGGALSEPEQRLDRAIQGLGQFPMVGYIYHASSLSSDEIWL